MNRSFPGKRKERSVSKGGRSLAHVHSRKHTHGLGVQAQAGVGPATNKGAGARPTAAPKALSSLLLAGVGQLWGGREEGRGAFQFPVCSCSGGTA